MLEATRELTLDEAEQVHGGGVIIKPPEDVLPGNPGNLMPVGGAGEAPPGGEGTGFNETAPGGNGLRGRSTTN